MQDGFIPLYRTDMYDGQIMLKDEHGHPGLFYYRLFNDEAVLFDENGVAYITQAGMARALNIPRQNVSRTIADLERKGYLDRGGTLQLMTSNEGQGTRLLVYYDTYIATVVAARLREPTSEAFAFLSFLIYPNTYSRDIVQNDNSAGKNALRGEIYLMGSVDVASEFKIGRAKNARKRLKSFTKLPRRIDLFHVMQSLDYKAEEKAIHDLLSQKRLGDTEWFKLAPSDVRLFCRFENAADYIAALRGEA